ncbi:hypothetical protein O181_067633 [Austropuccinia psidii MF-1]|uniref:DUF4939 domain-containing protein n=1 Tax=Austropuccinia psidii MF-1 TaxID=1389203 RepID=A0A9Q3I4P7_9BASI|nr:hypothetical protein [Austropuccinia psidii MF-1]
MSAQSSSCSHSNSKSSSSLHPTSSATEGPIRQRTPFGRSSTIQERRKTDKKIKFFLRSKEEEENSVEEEESDGTKGVPAPVGAFQGIGGQTLAQFDQPVSHHSEPSLLAIFHQMAQIMANLQDAVSSESSRPPAFNTPSMKAPECFYGTQTFKFRSFIQYFQLIFHNDMESLSQERKKVLYATSFLIGRAAKFIEPLSQPRAITPQWLLWQL